MTQPPTESQILARDCGRAMAAAHLNLQWAAPICNAGIQTVIVAIEPTSGQVNFAGSMPIDNLVLTLEAALVKARTAQIAERQKIVLPDGTTGTGLRIGG